MALLLSMAASIVVRSLPIVAALLYRRCLWNFLFCGWTATAANGCYWVMPQIFQTIKQMKWAKIYIFRKKIVQGFCNLWNLSQGLMNLIRQQWYKKCQLGFLIGCNLCMCYFFQDCILSFDTFRSKELECMASSGKQVHMPVATIKRTSQ